jgi:hypothetical protein
MITRENHEQHAPEDPGAPRLHPRRIPFEGKERLKRLDEDRLDYLVIAAAEGVLTDEERAFVEAACEREAFAASVAAYRRVSPDRSIRFPGKGRLHRRAPASLLRRALAGGIAAAVLACALLLWPRERGEEAVAATLAKPLQLAAGTRIVVTATPAPASLTPPPSPPLPRPVPSPVAASREVAIPLVVTPGTALPVLPDRLVARALPPRPAARPARRLVITIRPLDLLWDNGVVSSVATLLDMGREIAEDAGNRFALSLEMIKNGVPLVTY